MFSYNKQLDNGRLLIMCIANKIIKTHDSESRGQEEPATTE